MGERIRWRNRLAAWLWGRMNDAPIDLAMPVWIADAEADAEGYVGPGEDEYRAAYEQGCADGYAEAEREHRRDNW